MPGVGTLVKGAPLIGAGLTAIQIARGPGTFTHTNVDGTTDLGEKGDRAVMAGIETVSGMATSTVVGIPLAYAVHKTGEAAIDERNVERAVQDQVKQMSDDKKHDVGPNAAKLNADARAPDIRNYQLLNVLPMSSAAMAKEIDDNKIVGKLQREKDGRLSNTPENHRVLEDPRNEAEYRRALDSFDKKSIAEREADRQSWAERVFTHGNGEKYEHFVAAETNAAQAEAAERQLNAFHGDEADYEARKNMEHGGSEQNVKFTKDELFARNRQNGAAVAEAPNEGIIMVASKQHDTKGKDSYEIKAYSKNADGTYTIMADQADKKPKGEATNAQSLTVKDPKTGAQLKLDAKFDAANTDLKIYQQRPGAATSGADGYSLAGSNIESVKFGETAALTTAKAEAKAKLQADITANTATLQDALGVDPAHKGHTDTATKDAVGLLIAKAQESPEYKAAMDASGGKLKQNDAWNSATDNALKAMAARGEVKPEAVAAMEALHKDGALQYSATEVATATPATKIETETAPQLTATIEAVPAAAAPIMAQNAPTSTNPSRPTGSFASSLSDLGPTLMSGTTTLSVSDAFQVAAAPVSTSPPAPTVAPAVIAAAQTQTVPRKTAALSA